MATTVPKDGEAMVFKESYLIRSVAWDLFFAFFIPLTLFAALVAFFTVLFTGHLASSLMFGASAFLWGFATAGIDWEKAVVFGGSATFTLAKHELAKGSLLDPIADLIVLFPGWNWISPFMQVRANRAFSRSFFTIEVGDESPTKKARLIWKATIIYTFNPALLPVFWLFAKNGTLEKVFRSRIVQEVGKLLLYTTAEEAKGEFHKIVAAIQLYVQRHPWLFYGVDIIRIESTEADLPEKLQEAMDDAEIKQARMRDAEDYFERNKDKGVTSMDAAISHTLRYAGEEQLNTQVVRIEGLEQLGMGAEALGKGIMAAVAKFTRKE